MISDYITKQMINPVVSISIINRVLYLYSSKGYSMNQFLIMETGSPGNGSARFDKGMYEK